MVASTELRTVGSRLMSHKFDMCSVGLYSISSMAPEKHSAFSSSVPARSGTLKPQGNRAFCTGSCI